MTRFSFLEAAPVPSSTAHLAQRLLRQTILDFACTPQMLVCLTRFFRKLPTVYRHAVEFPHVSWNANAEVNELSQLHHIARVWISS